MSFGNINKILDKTYSLTQKNKNSLNSHELVLIKNEIYKELQTKDSPALTLDIIDEIFSKKTKQEAIELIDANSRLWMQFQSGSQGISGKKTVNALTKFEELFEVHNESEVEEHIDDSDDSDDDR
jgi:inactivated superfamily I helicase